MRVEYGYPQLGTVMRLAALQAVNVVDLIRAPEECCNPRLLNIGPIRSRRVRRHQQPAEHWAALKALVEELLKTDSSSMLPSKSSMCRHTGLLVSGFWQHFPELSVRYEAERKKRCDAIRSQGFKRIYEHAMRVLVENRGDVNCLSVRKGGAILSKNSSLPKHIVESALHTAKLAWARLQDVHIETFTL
jgi:hypothetical protein